MNDEMEKRITQNPLSCEKITIPEFINNDISNTNDDCQKIKKIVYISIVYNLIPFLLLISFIVYKDQINFNPLYLPFLPINIWMLIHSILGCCDSFSIILIVIFYNSIWNNFFRILWFVIYILRLFSFIAGFVIFYGNYSDHIFELYAINIILWITLIGGLIVFITQGCCKLNQFYAYSINVLDVY